MADRAGAPAQSWDASWRLARRVFQAQRDVETLTKDATIKGRTRDGKEYSYQGISSAQVVARAKAALLANGVLYTARIDGDKVKIDGNKTVLWVVGRFENVDDDTDVREIGMWGEGTDNSDNGHAKAFTNGNKQILSKQLNLTTVDDERTTDTAHERTPRSPAQREAEALSDVAIKQWADAYRDALRGAQSIKDLKRIRAENADMMKRVPDATREYFADLIAGLEGTLT